MTKEELLTKLQEISKGHWFGLPYGSYHHPEFTLIGSTFGQKPVCQRDTKERFEQIGLTEEDFKDKIVEDIGCCTGAMLLQAKQLGAKMVIGEDIHQPNIDFCETLFNELYPQESNTDWYFQQLNINTVNELDVHSSADIIFCLAISKWVNYDHLIKVLSNSGAKLIWFEDNKHCGQVIKDIIPGYDCEFKFASGPEANTPIGWKRMNYLCRRKI
jgi:SAM-dependent methyltransferase